MTRKVWLEVALNGPWSRARQPRIPVSVEEIVADGIACVKAGAAIVHVHAYDAESGRQKDDPAIYARIIEGIRANVDAIVYPTIPLAGGPDAARAGEGDGRARFAAIEALARQGLLEWAVIDPGSTNFSEFDDLAAGRSGFVYLNPETHVRTGLVLAQRHGFHPSYACYEPGFIRLGAALARQYPGAPAPVYRFMFSDGFTFGYPPAEYALDAMVRLLADEAPGAPWMAAGLAVDIRPLIAAVVARGGHVRVGLEDAPFGFSETNREMTERAARLIAEAGGTLATPAEVRQALS